MLAVLLLSLGLDTGVQSAIERAVQERLGDVRVVVLEWTGPRSTNAKLQGVTGPQSGGAEPALIALPAPGSRLGGDMRFVLIADGKRVGAVTVRLDVTGRAVRATQSLTRGERVQPEAVDVVDVPLTGMSLRRLPALSDVLASQTRRNIAPGEILTDALLAVPPLVQTGDEIRVLVKTGPVEVTGMGRASGSGRLGDRIRVLMPSRSRALEGRITGPGSVEIVQ